MDLNPNWDFVADTVMGGVSDGAVTQEVILNRNAYVLRGHVSLDNNGGFVQMAFDLNSDGSATDASDWTGIELTIWGNDDRYDLRLRTDQLTRPWQSFRTEFTATARWQTLRIPFTDFASNKTDATFDPAQLRRIGVLAVGRAFTAEIAVADIRLYRD